jgi:hypothetical protein
LVPVELGTGGLHEEPLSGPWWTLFADAGLHGWYDGTSEALNGDAPMGCSCPPMSVA